MCHGAALGLDTLDIVGYWHIAALLKLMQRWVRLCGDRRDKGRDGKSVQDHNFYSYGFIN
jgi:hypothetical protein